MTDPSTLVDDDTGVVVNGGAVAIEVGASITGEVGGDAAVVVGSRPEAGNGASVPAHAATARTRPKVATQEPRNPVPCRTLSKTNEPTREGLHKFNDRQ